MKKIEYYSAHGYSEVLNCLESLANFINSVDYARAAAKLANFVNEQKP